MRGSYHPLPTIPSQKLLEIVHYRCQKRLFVKERYNYKENAQKVKQNFKMLKNDLKYLIYQIM